MPQMPFLKFFPNDWLAEPTIRVCSVAARGLWMDMLSLMHLSPRRGYLLAATGSPISPEQLARLTGCSADDVTRLLAELRSSGTFNCTDDGTIYNRRMVRDEGKREKCSEAGRRGGGNPNIRKENITPLKVVPKVGSKVVPKVGPNLRGQRPEAKEENNASHCATGPPLKVPDSDHKQAVAVFCDSWAIRYGAAYPFNGGKDGSAVKWMLGQVDGAAFAKVVARYIADDDPFVVENRHTIGLLRSQFAKWLVERPLTNSKSVKSDAVTEYAKRTVLGMFDT